MLMFDFQLAMSPYVYILVGYVYVFQLAMCMFSVGYVYMFQLAMCMCFSCLCVCVSAGYVYVFQLAMCMCFSWLCVCVV